MTSEVGWTDLGNRREDSPRCLYVRMNLSRHWMSIQDGLVGHGVMLTVAIWATTLLNFFNDLTNDEIQSIRAIGLSVLLTADAMLWTGAATMLIAEMASFVASISRATSAVVTSEASGWSVVISWFIHEDVFGRKLWTQPRGPWACRHWFRYLTALHLEISRRWKATGLKAC